MDSLVIACSACGRKNSVPADKQHLAPKCGDCGKPLELGGRGVPVELTDASFDEVVGKAPGPVLVDFYSSTCGPCQELAPVLERLAARYGGRVLVGKVNAPENMGLSLRFGIRGVPVLLFFRNGEMVQRLMGAQPAEEIVRILDGLLGA